MRGQDQRARLLLNRRFNAAPGKCRISTAPTRNAATADTTGTPPPHFRKQKEQRVVFCRDGFLPTPLSQMSQTRTQAAPVPSPVDPPPYEDEPPRRVKPAAAEALPPTKEALPSSNGETGSTTILVSGEPSSRLARLGKGLSGVGEDLKKIAGLRVALAKAELTEQVNYGVGRAKQGSVAGAIALVGAFFLLVTTAIGLGSLLGHMFWGFLIVTSGLFVGGGVAWLVLKPKPPTT